MPSFVLLVLSEDNCEHKYCLQMSPDTIDYYSKRHFIYKIIDSY